MTSSLHKSRLDESLAQSVAAAYDPRLRAWALGTLSPREVDALVAEADQDPDLARQLERLRPLDDEQRDQMFLDAVESLRSERPTAQHSWRQRAGPLRLMAAAMAVAVVGFIVVFGAASGPSIALLERPEAHRTIAPMERVALSVQLNGGHEAPRLFVVTPDGIRPVPLDWTVAERTAYVEGPACMLTGGHFGSLELLVVPAGGMPDPARIPANAARTPIRVGLPSYSIERAVAILDTRMRSSEVGSADDIINVPPTAKHLVLTFRPNVAVRSGTMVCVFQKIGTDIRLVGPGCHRMRSSRLELALPADEIASEDGAPSHRLIFAIGPQEPSANAKAARAFLAAPRAHSGWQRLELKVATGE